MMTAIVPCLSLVSSVTAGVRTQAVIVPVPCKRSLCSEWSHGATTSHPSRTHRSLSKGISLLLQGIFFAPTEALRRSFWAPRVDEGYNASRSLDHLSVREREITD